MELRGETSWLFIILPPNFVQFFQFEGWTELGPLGSREDGGDLRRNWPKDLMEHLVLGDKMTV